MTSLNELGYNISNSSDSRTTQLTHMRNFDKILEKSFVQEADLKKLNQQTTEYLKFIDALNNHAYELMIKLAEE